MISRYEAWLNGVALSSVNPGILILDIEQQPAQIRNDTFTVAKRNGARIHRRYTEKASVTIRFAIREYDINKRQAVCSDVVRWAKSGGILKTNDRAGQILHCICETFPAVYSAKQWTDALQITFSAYAVPYWEDEELSVLRLSGTSGEGTMYVPGNADGALIEVTATAVSGFTRLMLAANGQGMNLSGLSVQSGDTLTLAYDENGIQSIKVGNVSVLSSRVGADDLLAVGGAENVFAFSANGNVDVDFKVRGLWL